MAIFEGTVQEFHRYVGPRIRNAINLFARRERLARKGVCEHCKQTGQVLESAHVHGKGRRAIIEAILKAHERNGRVRCDIRTVENQILEGHGPVANAFKFLCKDCHRRYDAVGSQMPKDTKRSGGSVVERVARCLAFVAALLLGLVLLAIAKP